MLHSQGDGEGDATFVLDAHMDQGALEIVVRDFGGGLLRAPAGSGGLGLGMHLIEQLSESSQVSSRPGGGTRVSMRFPVLAENAEAARRRGDAERRRARGARRPPVRHEPDRPR